MKFSVLMKFLVTGYLFSSCFAFNPILIDFLVYFLDSLFVKRLAAIIFIVFDLSYWGFLIDFYF